MFNEKIVASAIVCTILFPSLLLSADKVYLEQSDNHDIVSVKADNTLGNNSKIYNSALGFSDEISLEVRRSYTSKKGKVTTRYTQKYKGIPILEEELIIAQRMNLRTQQVYGSALYGISKDIQDINVKLTEKEALQIAKDVFTKQSTKIKQSVSESQYAKETSTLKIWQNQKGVATLVYDVQFMYSGKNPTMPHFYIDANTGIVLFAYDNLMHSDATGPGGNLKTGRYEYGTDYAALNVTVDAQNCSLINTNVATMDLNHGSDYGLPLDPFTFTCPENTHKEINGAYSPLNDAHFFGGVVFDMYNDWFATPPLTFQLVMQVHYQTNYENAFWDGSRMTFGDGATTFYPLVDLNVVSHEVSHGFTQQNSNLVYSNQAGGLNESFSDMAGEAAEYYVKGTNDWYVGAEIMKSSAGLRSMSDPTSIPPSIDHQDDYYDGLDVHHSSGVYNKAFYLLATATGWNTRKAFEVYTKANQEYWTSGTDWNVAGIGVINAASDLGYNTVDVNNSLIAVGVIAMAPPPPPPTYTILDIVGEWTVSSEDSIHRPGKYAEYHTFTLTRSTEVTIDLTSATDPYLFLLNDSDATIEYNDDGGEGYNSQITSTLDAGTYTIEATTYDASATGTFTLQVIGAGEAPKTSFIPIITYLLN